MSDKPITLTNHPAARTAAEIELGFQAEPADIALVFATIAKHFAILPGKAIAMPDALDAATERD